MIAALDASALIILGKADALGLLVRVFQGLMIPPAVRKEAITDAPTAMEANALSIEVERSRIATVVPAEASKKALQAHQGVLGPGEIETIALVLSKKAQVAVIDDRIARQVASLEKAPTVGTLGVLARAYKKGLLERDDLRKLLERITAAGLWVRPDVMEAFWASLGGR